jgi:carbon-monoxide dehydrogenase medium subunit
MQAFQYHRAASASSAAELLKGEAKYLAGGQSLLASMRLGLASPSDLVDLGGAADLKGVKVEGSSIVIGAMTRHAEVAAHAEVKSRIPGLATLAGGIGDRQVRNVGTLGGSLANNDPAACYPAAVLGLGATIHTNSRKIAADDYFRGLFETALAPGELITAVSFPIASRSAYVKFKQPASRFAMVGVFVSQGSSGVRVAVTGAGSGGVFRVPAMEAALGQSWSADAVKGIRVDAGMMLSDLHASAEYRAHLVSVIAARAVVAAR